MAMAVGTVVNRDPSIVVWLKGRDTMYTQANYDAWRAHFGQSDTPGAGAIVYSVVSEPACIALLLMGTLAMCFVHEAEKSRKLNSD
jgi:hypothetical protein